MAAVPKEVLSSLGDIVEQFHSALAKCGSDSIKSELSTCKWKNFFGLSEVLSRWDSILIDLKTVARKLKKGDSEEILKAATNLSKSITQLQLLILNVATEVGSFIPGPVGIVCSLVLAIGCFTTGDVPAGLLNLLGAIPGGKLLKHFPFKGAVLKFQCDLWSKWGYKTAALTQKAARDCQHFRFSEKYSSFFAVTMNNIKGQVSMVGEKIAKKNDEILTGINDGWNKAREELKATQSFEYMLSNSLLKY